MCLRGVQQFIFHIYIYFILWVVYGRAGHLIARHLGLIGENGIAWKIRVGRREAYGSGPRFRIENSSGKPLTIHGVYRYTPWARGRFFFMFCVIHSARSGELRADKATSRVIYIWHCNNKVATSGPTKTCLLKVGTHIRLWTFYGTQTLKEW